MTTTLEIPGLGLIDLDSGLELRSSTSDQRFVTGRDGVQSIVSTRDRTVEFVAFDAHTLAHITSDLGYPAYYPIRPVSMDDSIQVVLMDLDGTTVKSEEFWLGVIERTIGSLSNDPHFSLAQKDLPHVMGHSVSQHLAYCIGKYCPRIALETARAEYQRQVEVEKKRLLRSRDTSVIRPAPGLVEFLRTLKAKQIKIGLVTAGQYEKAKFELDLVFDLLGLGAADEFYDAIITGGIAFGSEGFATMGELSAKPHPWLYAEAATVGLGVKVSARSGVVGIEDTGAGICSIRLAGFSPIGLYGGNIVESGAKSLCSHYCENLEEITPIIT